MPDFTEFLKTPRDIITSAEKAVNMQFTLKHYKVKYFGATSDLSKIETLLLYSMIPDTSQLYGPYLHLSANTSCVNDKVAKQFPGSHLISVNLIPYKWDETKEIFSWSKDATYANCTYVLPFSHNQGDQILSCYELINTFKESKSLDANKWEPL